LGTPKYWDLAQKQAELSLERQVCGAVLTRLRVRNMDKKQAMLVCGAWTSLQ
jgi:hypothetical protein